MELSPSGTHYMTGMVSTAAREKVEQAVPDLDFGRTDIDNLLCCFAPNTSIISLGKEEHSCLSSLLASVSCVIDILSCERTLSMEGRRLLMDVCG